MPVKTLRKIVSCSLFLLVLRFALAGIFLTAGFGKIFAGNAFPALADIGFLPAALLGPVNVLLPWIEIIFGLLLIFGPYLRPVLVIFTLLISAFAAFNIYNIALGNPNDCHCFGLLFTLSHWQALLIDSGMLAASGLLLARPNKIQKSRQEAAGIFRNGVIRAAMIVIVIAANVLPTVVFAAGPISSITTHPVMHPSEEQMVRWEQDYLNGLPPSNQAAPRMLAAALPSSFSLLSDISYVPGERNQGSAGNCWVWAGTGLMETALDVNKSLHDRLSIQYFDSNFNSGTIGNWASCGGDLNTFASFYSSQQMIVPWSNTNAGYQDTNNSCSDSPAVKAASIDTSFYYPVSASITSASVTTIGVDQATAISNIKNILVQNQAVYFGFYLSASGWSNFNDFWDNQSENSIIDLDTNYDGTQSGGHGVVCVGYDDTTSPPCWIMLNSWGTTDGRPNGLFRVSQNLNYSSTLGATNYCFKFQFLNNVYDATWPGVTTGNATDITGGTATLNCNITALSTSDGNTATFQWGTASGSYTHTTNSINVSGTGNYSAALTGLQTSTKYYFRAAAAGSTTFYGSEKSFTTLDHTVVTDAATNVGTTSAALNGELTGSDGNSQKVSFEYGADTTYGAEIAGSPSSLSSAQPFSANLNGLSTNTIYHYRAKADDGATISYGADMTFKTKTFNLNVNVSPANSGEVNCSPDQLGYDSSDQLTLTAIPANDTWFFSHWGGTLTGSANPASLTISSDTTVTAYFTQTQWTIAASAGTGGTITPNGNVSANDGADQTFTITPGTGYDISDVLVDGKSVGPVTSYAFSSVSVAHTIAAQFTIQTFVITASVSGDPPHGSVTPPPDPINYGNNATIGITPGIGYHVTSLTDNGAPVALSSIQNNKYIINNVTATHDVTVTFAVDPVKVAFTSAPQTITAGAVTGQITIQVEDGTGAATTVAQDTTITVTSSSAAGRFDTSATGQFGNTTLTITVAAGTGSAGFFYMDTLAGNPVVTLATSGSILTGDTQTETITPGTLYSINITPADPSIKAGITRQFSAQGYDQYQNAIQGLKYRWTVINITTAGSIDNSGLFTAGGTPGSYSGVIRASATTDTGTIRGYTGVTITPGDFDRYGISTITSPQSTGVPFSVTVQAEDSSGNALNNISENLTVTFGKEDAGATPATATVANGAATFSVTLTAVQAGQSVTVTGGLSGKSGTSNLFDVAAGGIYHTITATAGSNGSISPSGQVQVSDGSSLIFTITPANKFHILDVVVDGTSVGAVSTYTFNGVTADHTIAATFSGQPLLATLAATDISTSGATLHADLTDSGNSDSVAVSFEYGKTSGYGNTAAGVPANLAEPGSFTAVLSGLDAGTTYYFRAKATGNGAAYGDSLSFTTISNNPGGGGDNGGGNNGGGGGGGGGGGPTTITPSGLSGNTAFQVNGLGVVQQAVQLTTSDGDVRLSISSGTTALVV